MSALTDRKPTSFLRPNNFDHNHERESSSKREFIIYGKKSLPRFKSTSRAHSIHYSTEVTRSPASANHLNCHQHKLHHRKSPQPPQKPPSAHTSMPLNHLISARLAMASERQVSRESRLAARSDALLDGRFPIQMCNLYKRSNNYFKSNASLSRLMLLVATFTLLLITICNQNEVQALNCYHCSSADNPSCDEPFTGRANFSETDCSKYIDKPAKVCRKLVQYIEHKKVVIRSCGFIDDRADQERKPMCFKRSGTFNVMMESCNCYEDNCNRSASLVPSSTLISGISALLLTCMLNHLRCFSWPRL